MAFVNIGPSVYDGTMQQLRDDVARQNALMAAAMYKDLNIVLRWGDALRTDAEQEIIFRARYLPVSYNTGIWWNGTYWKKRPGVPVAAVPGKSNHRLGTTIDYFIIVAVLNWLRKNAWKYGFSNTEGAASGENWHWGYTLVPIITAGAALYPASTGPLPQELDQKDEDMTQIYEANSDGAFPGIFKGWRYKEMDDGCLRPMTSASWEAFKATHPGFQCAVWGGDTLSEHAKTYGLMKFTGSAATGPLGMTGERIGGNATVLNQRGTIQAHWPYAEDAKGRDIGF